ncbi:uncharacterized protein RCC_01549 [Ramularia collo-cygni]|uniref:Uncharacterized protein n=1 Tax=Ramularia collo-cygni TaxID=112498 RepID=A0A2D3UQU0_9PEZI|nr:uncharacterized protein RCC_01549 [Ramularia collo-cygni]CZT15715.1 uncharacterized protein RCC_01549 [Ramularia collo-cygni]
MAPKKTAGKSVPDSTSKVVKTPKVLKKQPKITKKTPDSPEKKKKKKKEGDGLCKGGAQRILEPLVAQLDAVIANKGDWCDGKHFRPARALLQSWLDEKTGASPKPPQKMNKFAAKKTFIEPIIGQLEFIADNKDWCDGGKFSEARAALQAWMDTSAGESLCKGGAERAIYPIANALHELIEKKGSWCDGNRFGPARDLLDEWLMEQGAHCGPPSGMCG